METRGIYACYWYCENNKEKTTSDAFYNACGEIYAEISALKHTASLFSEFGDEKMAKRLEHISRELEFSVAIIEKYMAETHALMVERANESSNNLFRLGMGLSGIIGERTKESKNVCADWW